MRASEVAAALFAGRSTNDSFGAFLDLAEDANDVAHRLAEFGTTLDSSACDAKQSIVKVTTDIATLLAANQQHNTDSRQIYYRAALIKLAKVEAHVSYLLHDRQTDLRNRTERAFEHLLTYRGR